MHTGLDESDIKFRLIRKGKHRLDEFATAGKGIDQKALIGSEIIYCAGLSAFHGALNGGGAPGAVVGAMKETYTRLAWHEYIVLEFGKKSSSPSNGHVICTHFFEL